MGDSYEIARALYWSRMFQVVNEYREDGTFNSDVASETLRGWSEYCRVRERPVELPPIFAELLAKAVAGELGRRKPAKKLSHIERRVLVEKFRAAREREGPGSYAALLNQFAKAWGVSEAYIKTLNSQENGESPDHE